MNKRLKAKIIEKYGSQFHFARAINSQESVISRVIHGHRLLTPDEQHRWADVLGIGSNNDIFEGDSVNE